MISMILGTRFSILGTQIGSLKHLQKNPDTAYIHLGAIRVIWASVVCNQDQCRDWL